MRVERAGLRADDYRPGLPLQEFLTVFVPAEARTGENRAVSHVEQVHASRCYRSSAGRHTEVPGGKEQSWQSGPGRAGSRGGGT